MTINSRIRNLLQKLGAGYRVLTGHDSFSVRVFLARQYFHGHGLEVGALDKPLSVPRGVKVRYVDRFAPEELLRHYPELGGRKLVPVDIVTDGETLVDIEANSQDFIIANHFLEHCQDFIGSLKNFLRVIRPGGILFLALPDKRHTFDRDRPETSFEHLLEDHRNGPEGSRSDHFREWVRYVDQKTDAVEIESETKRLMEMSYSIHFHVFTAAGFFQILGRLAKEEGLKFQVAAFLENEDEFICILRKSV